MEYLWKNNYDQGINKCLYQGPVGYTSQVINQIGLQVKHKVMGFHYFRDNYCHSSVSIEISVILEAPNVHQVGLSLSFTVKYSVSQWEEL